ncbi:helix-turn-helix transcriptional regulator, partial [Halomicrococcus sp. NG-SE-24]|uniref:helix-turn-helix transcriptional regulator n=1 Tax=Halomicrococcus sp. NG-SE-24 TaxID=3436928 RepID=UPI003D9844DB
MHDLTGFQRDLLYVVNGLDDPHGLAIKDELEDYYEKEIHHGRLYPNLDTLVDKGLVEKGEIDNRTNFYTLTQRG